MTISLINTQWEQISIETVKEGELEGQKLLVIHDDGDAATDPTRAAILLDEFTVKWLLLALADIAKDIV